MADELTTKRIINLPAESAPVIGDVLVVDNESTGTKKIEISNLIEAVGDVLEKEPQAPVRNAIYTLLSKAAYANAAGVQDSIAVLQTWAQQVTSLILNKSSISLTAAGATEQITAAVVPVGAAVTWSSSDDTIATVDSTGLVTAIRPGNAVITATSGNLTRTCFITASWEIPDTTAQIAQENTRFHDVGNTHTTQTQENAGITIVYEMDAPTTVLYPAGVIVGDGLTSNNENCTMRVFKDGAFVNYWGIYDRWLKAPASSYEEYKRSTNISEYNEIAFTLDMRYLDDSYMYDYTTGQIWFAGINTPYYGMSNVSEAV